MGMDLDGDGTDDDLERALEIKLGEVRADRVQDGVKGTAVAALHKLELDILEKLDVERRAREQREGLGGRATDDELVAHIVAVVAELTVDQFARVAAAVDARRAS